VSPRVNLFCSVLLVAGSQILPSVESVPPARRPIRGNDTDCCCSTLPCKQPIKRNNQTVFTTNSHRMAGNRGVKEILKPLFANSILLEVSPSPIPVGPRPGTGRLTAFVTKSPLAGRVGWEKLKLRCYCCCTLRSSSSCCLVGHFPRKVARNGKSHFSIASPPSTRSP
jgi:hypothetical protein